MPEVNRKTPLLNLQPLLAGAALILAFPPFEQGWLAWFALAPLIRFSLQSKPGPAFRGGFLFGLPLHLYLNCYLGGALFTYLPPALAVAVLALLIALLSSFSGLFALAVSCFRRLRSPLLLALSIPALWVLIEYLRSVGFTGYNVGYLGYTQWHCPIVLNLAASYGYWGLSFALVLFQSTLLLGLGRTLRGRDLLAAAAIFGIIVGLGVGLPARARIEREAEPLWTALIQGCTSPEETLAAGRDRAPERYLELTREAVGAEPRVELALWPETVVALKVRKAASLHRVDMARLADELGVGLLYGAQVTDGDDLSNALILLSPGEDGAQIYRKRRLVPFVERFPWEKLLNRALDLDFPLGRYREGEEFTLFRFRDIPLAGVICFESYFGGYTRHFAQGGGRHLFIATNDAWFGKTIGLEQHAQVAALRAAEMGIGVTQIANSGISISFDCRGQELLRTGKGERGFRLLPLDLARRPTLYRRWGDYFLLLCLLPVAAAAAGSVKNLSPPPAVFRRRKSR